MPNLLLTSSQAGRNHLPKKSPVSDPSDNGTASMKAFESTMLKVLKEAENLQDFSVLASFHSRRTVFPKLAKKIENNHPYYANIEGTLLQNEPFIEEKTAPITPPTNHRFTGMSDSSDDSDMEEFDFKALLGKEQSNESAENSIEDQISEKLPPTKDQLVRPSKGLVQKKGPYHKRAYEDNQENHTKMSSLPSLPGRVKSRPASRHVDHREHCFRVQQFRLECRFSSRDSIDQMDTNHDAWVHKVYRRRPASLDDRRDSKVNPLVYPQGPVFNQRKFGKPSSICLSTQSTIHGH